jgi:hypothetical protein
MSADQLGHQYATEEGVFRPVEGDYRSVDPQNSLWPDRFGQSTGRLSPHRAIFRGHNLRNIRRMSWFRVKRGHLEYRGRLTRGSFTKWTATKEGADAVARVARGIRFGLLSRARSARRRIWRALEAAARVESVATAIGIEATRYMQVLADLSYADALPRAHIALHRLVLVPRAMIAGRARPALFERLARAPALGELDHAVRIFFLNQLVVEMDAALQQGSPSPRRPVQAHEEWACVGIRTGIVWVDPLWAGPDATGHVFMYEFPRGGLPRRARKVLEAAIEQMAASVSSLSRLERAALVRAASLRSE